MSSQLALLLPHRLLSEFSQALVFLVLSATRTSIFADHQCGFAASEFTYKTAPFPQCHASSIAETRDGLVAAWSGGTREGSSDLGIRLSRHEHGKRTSPVEVATGAQSATKRHPCRVTYCVGWSTFARPTSMPWPPSVWWQWTARVIFAPGFSNA